MGFPDVLKLYLNKVTVSHCRADRRLISRGRFMLASRKMYLIAETAHRLYGCLYFQFFPGQD